MDGHVDGQMHRQEGRRHEDMSLARSCLARGIKSPTYPEFSPRLAVPGLPASPSGSEPADCTTAQCTRS